MMQFDTVHDIQQAFRKIVRAAAFPGTLEDLSAEMEKLEKDMPVHPVLLLWSLVLLDGEVTFCVESENKAEQEELLSRLTYSRAVPVSEADFVFVPDSGTAAGDVIRQMREGDLVDPHKGASLVLCADTLSGEGDLVLSGPGIRDQVRLGAAREPSWLEARNHKNREYPLGIDLFLVTQSGLVTALPRTTQIRPEEVL